MTYVVNVRGEVIVTR